MKKENIRFSILVPVYQVEPYIEECIQSVLNQTYKNWELILVDDGSKDKGGVICDRYAEQYENIHVYHKENRGLIHTRRYGIERARGDYYVFLDSDDTLKPNALEVIHTTIQEQNCDCVIYGYERFLNGKGMEQSADEVECCITDKRELYKKCCMGGYGYLWRKAVKATAFQGLDYSPYYHIQLFEDELQSLEILKYSDRVYFITDRLYNYRINPNSITQKPNPKYARDAVEVRYKMNAFFQKENVFQEEDYIMHGGVFVSLFYNLLCKIGMSEGSFVEKEQNLQKMKDEEMYHWIISEGKYNKKDINIKGRIILSLFMGGHYKMIILISTIYKRLLMKNRK